jgi:cyclase
VIAPEPVLEEVGDGIWAYLQPDGSWGLNNTGFLVGREAVTAVDTCFTERRTRAFLTAIASVTDRPVRTLVNTHHHGDHTHGNWLLPAATVVGHERCRSAVLESGLVAETLFPGVDWGEIRIAPPFVTFADRMTVHVDDLAVELQFMGPAHTTNDVVAWLPGRQIVFAGDLVFAGSTPFVLMGSVSGTVTAVERLAALLPTTIVPGHGPVSGPAVLEDQLAYLRFVQDVAADGRRAGVTPLDAAREADLGDFASWPAPERLVGNLHRAMAELDGAAPGADLDLPAAIGDMIAYNGGEPLRCLA